MDFGKVGTWADKQHVYAVVESPRGSHAKLEFDPKLGAFTLSKPLLAGLTYPYDWGFIPSTRADDGDPLDVLIIHDAATYPGLIMKCRPIGVLEMTQRENGKSERNDRLFAVPDRVRLRASCRTSGTCPNARSRSSSGFFRRRTRSTARRSNSKAGVDRTARRLRFERALGQRAARCPATTDPRL